MIDLCFCYLIPTFPQQRFCNIEVIIGREQGVCFNRTQCDLLINVWDEKVKCMCSRAGLGAVAKRKENPFPTMPRIAW